MRTNTEDKANSGYISDRETLERLVRLETTVNLRFTETDRALVLARDLIERDRKEATMTLNHRLEHMNQFQKRMDKLEGTFATKPELARVQKFIWIGIGLFIAFELLLRIYAFIDK